jgi:hypothetical protein
MTSRSRIKPREWNQELITEDEKRERARLHAINIDSWRVVDDKLNELIKSGYELPFNCATFDDDNEREEITNE